MRLRNFSNHRKQTGFTLLEVLIAALVLTVVGVILAEILTRTFTNNQKITLLNNTKQNGQIANDIMSHNIRQAEDIICVSGSGSGNILVLKQTSSSGPTQYFRFTIVPESASANGYIQEDTKDSTTLTEAVARTQMCSGSDSLGGVVRYLTNNNVSSGASIESGSFTKINPSQGKNAVSITFNIKPGTKVPNRTSYDTLTFSTTVQLR